MSRYLVAPILALALAASSAAVPVLAAKPPATWDNLVRVESKKIDGVYLLPGADFRGYTKIMFDPTEVAFRKNFKRDYNDTMRELSQRLSDDDIQKGMDEVRTGFGKVFKEAYEKAGYEIVTAPGPDVLRLRTAVADLYVTAPDTMSAGRSRSYSRDAGEATVIIEVRDSVTGALLGRAVDARTVGDMTGLRTSVSNRADFEQTFRTWATACVNGLAELKARSPIAETAPAK